jgi:hypothetical protein
MAFGALISFSYMGDEINGKVETQDIKQHFGIA